MALFEMYHIKTTSFSAHDVCRIAPKGRDSPYAPYSPPETPSIAPIFQKMPSL